MKSSDIALADIAGPLKDILDRLSGKNAAAWLEAWKLFLRTSPQITIVKLKEMMFKIWKKIDIGGGDTANELITTLSQLKLPNGNTGKICLQTARLAQLYCKVSLREEGVEFVAGSAYDLFSLTEHTLPNKFLDEVFLADRGLEFCKPIDAFYLRLNYLDQPLNEAVRVGMRLVTPESQPWNQIFILHNQAGDLWLDSNRADCRSNCSPEHLWVFRRKK